MSKRHYQSYKLRLRFIRPMVLGFIGVFTLFKIFATCFQFNIEPEPEPAPQPQPIIGKVTMIYGNNSIYERGLKTHEEHSRRFGYPLSVLRRPIVDGTFNKYAALLSEILSEMEKPSHEQLQWLFWFDSDTVLMNPNIPLEIFLPPSRLANVHLLLSKDWNGINNGVFFIRVNAWSVALLSAALSYPQMNPNIPLYWPDQSALSNILDEHESFSDSIVICPLRWFNAYMRSDDGLKQNPDSPVYLQVHPGDLLVHFPGTPREHLNQTLSPYLEIAESHQPEWEPAVEDTDQVDRIQRFWQLYEPEDVSGETQEDETLRYPVWLSKSSPSHHVSTSKADGFDSAVRTMKAHRLKTIRPKSSHRKEGIREK